MNNTIEEIRDNYEKRLKRIDDLYADNLISSLELAAMKDSADNEFRKNLSEAKN